MCSAVIPRNWIGRNKRRPMARTVTPTIVDPIDIYAFPDPREHEDRKWGVAALIIAVAIVSAAGGYLWAALQAVK